MVSLVRPAELDDASAIARVHVATWRSAYHGLLPDDFLASLSQTHYEERWRRTLGDSSARIYVAENVDGAVGFASGGPERAGESGYAGEIIAIYFLEDEQARGHGRRAEQAVLGA